MNELVDAMQERIVPKSCFVVREGKTRHVQHSCFTYCNFLGEYGSHLYVSAEGEFDVIKDEKVIGRLGVGKAFGELAILYNCKRTASVRAITNGKV